MSGDLWNRKAPMGPYWKKRGKDVSGMVKGVSRQVIVVKSPDPRFFEQAIFILKDEAFGRGVSPEAVVQEACRVADGYVRRHTHWRAALRQIPAPAYTAMGAVLATVCWCVALAL